MRRRDLLTAGAMALLTYRRALAETGRRYRVGAIWSAPRGPTYLAFNRRLAELGYVEGDNIILDARAHEGRLERLPALAAELVRLQPDVIVAGGAEAVLKAIVSETSSIPIVMAAYDYDPVALGYVAGLPRPGGQVTGVFLRQIELTAKRVELLREALPELTGI